jgi:hypothetical protein
VPYKIYLCGPDDRGKPSSYLARRTEVMACPREAEHRYGPVGYCDWHDWADRRRKTHNTKMCECGFYLLLEPKPVREPRAMKQSER